MICTMLDKIALTFSIKCAILHSYAMYGTYRETLRIVEVEGHPVSKEGMTLSQDCLVWILQKITKKHVTSF